MRKGYFLTAIWIGIPSLEQPTIDKLPLYENIQSVISFWVGYDEGFTWWATWNEGPRVASATCAWNFHKTVNDTWPSNWPNLTIEWKLQEHSASGPDSNHNRIFSYSESTYLSNSWGENNRDYSVAGLHRLYATAKMHPGTAWEQSVKSYEKEYAIRICCKRWACSHR